ncbi:IclR family transcriptional regulator domain-containing protein [Halopelagius inordinatus]|uniref:IclR family transcriptional regulator domain-containing protein n=1 Tax=Halopelagius inordinatus TaxID=553467 RepID=UPI000B877AE6|nr:IclR family transcriptional regulator C-terminal domain-containing protein [Halopelagius inordinatus]
MDSLDTVNGGKTIGSLETMFDIVELVEGEVEKLAREAETTALFAVHRQGRSVFVAQSSSGPLDGTEYFGRERYLHNTAFGKVLLAWVPAEAVVTIIERDAR